MSEVYVHVCVRGMCMCVVYMYKWVRYICTSVWVICVHVCEVYVQVCDVYMHMCGACTYMCGICAYVWCTCMCVRCMCTCVWVICSCVWGICVSVCRYMCRSQGRVSGDLLYNSIPYWFEARSFIEPKACISQRGWCNFPAILLSMSLLVLESEKCRPRLALCMLQPRLVLHMLQSELCSLCFCSKCSQPLSHCSSLGVHSYRANPAHCVAYSLNFCFLLKY